MAVLALPALARAECVNTDATTRVCSCRGTITDIFVTSGVGEVQVRPTWRNDWVRICTLTTDKFCSAWLAQALVAQQTQKPTVIRYVFNPATASYTDCSDIPKEAYAPTPASFMNNP